MMEFRGRINNNNLMCVLSYKFLTDIIKSYTGFNFELLHLFAD